MRDHQRGRIYRIVYKGAPPAKKRSLSKTDPAGLLDALASDNMFWRLHAQRLLVERGTEGRRAAARRARAQPVGRCHRHQRRGLPRAVDAAGSWRAGHHDERRVSRRGWSAEASCRRRPQGRRHGAAAHGGCGQAILTAGLLQDPDLHTRLAATLALADMPASPESGRRCTRRARCAELHRQVAEPRVLHRGDAAPEASRPRTTPIATRCRSPRCRRAPDRDIKPDWRAPAAAELASDWKDMQVPGNWEARGLPDFDGVVWFTRTPWWRPAPSPTTLTWAGAEHRGSVGQRPSLTARRCAPRRPRPRRAAAAVGPSSAAGRARRWPCTSFPRARCTPGRIDHGPHPEHAGTRADSWARRSRCTSRPADEVPLAGTWKYRVERQTNAGALYAKPGELAAHVALTAEGGAAGAAGAALPPPAAQAPDVVLRLAVIPG